MEPLFSRKCHFYDRKYRGTSIALSRATMYLADFKIHSTFSDGSYSIPEIVDIYGARGFGAIAITDRVCDETTVLGRAAQYMNRSLIRANVALYIKILRSEIERAWHDYRMLVLPGFEYSQSFGLNQSALRISCIADSSPAGLEGLYNTLAYIDPARSGATMLDVVNSMRREGAANSLITAAPTRILWERRAQYEGLFDAWEVTQSGALSDTVLRSSLPKIAGSGFRKLNQMASWKTVLLNTSSAAAVIAAVKAREVGFMLFRGSSHDVSSGVHSSGVGGGAGQLTSLRNVVVTQAFW